jgi:sulfur carrier protein ThiS
MLVRLIRRGCGDVKTCPALHQTDRDTVVIQGWVVTDARLLSQLGLPPDTQAVEVPAELLAEVIDSWPALHPTGHGTLIVPGTPVTDPDALRHLNLPPNEQAVEVPASLLTEVLQAC